MTKIVFALLIAFCLNAVAGFEDEGFSRANCKSAQEDALSLARANCMGMDTQTEKNRMGTCRKDKQGYFKVKVSYNCAIEQDQEDGYSQTIDEELDSTYL